MMLDVIKKISISKVSMKYNLTWHKRLDKLDKIHGMHKPTSMTSQERKKERKTEIV
jgi:hypothetical protein